MLKKILTNPSVLSVLNGQLRHLGTFVGGALVTYGVIETADVQAVVGVVVTVGGMVLSALAKRA